MMHISNNLTTRQKINKQKVGFTKLQWAFIYLVALGFTILATLNYDALIKG